ncbi:hypothetical protein V8E54_009043 [Elaphomyces granulatus]
MKPASSAGSEPGTCLSSRNSSNRWSLGGWPPQQPHHVSAQCKATNKRQNDHPAIHQIPPTTTRYFQKRSQADHRPEHRFRSHCRHYVASFSSCRPCRRTRISSPRDPPSSGLKRFPLASTRPTARSLIHYDRLAEWHGIDMITEDGAAKYEPDPETLMTVMDVQEAMAEAVEGEEAEATVTRLKTENASLVESSVKVLAEAFECMRLRFWYTVGRSELRAIH